MCIRDSRSSERPNGSTLRWALTARFGFKLRLAYQSYAWAKLSLARPIGRVVWNPICHLGISDRSNRTRQSPCSLRRFRLRYEWLLLLGALTSFFFFRNFNGQGPVLVASGRWSTLEGPISKELTCSINL